MEEPRTRNSIPRILRQPSNGIPGYQDKPGAEQIRLFSTLIQEKGGAAVRKLWPQLDPYARSYVMQRLGCFAGPDAPQDFFLPRFKQRRSVGLEASRQVRKLKKYVKATEESARRFKQLEFPTDHHERLISALRGALAAFENLVVVSARYFSGPTDLEIRSIIEAQEFMKRRSTFLKTPAALRPAAIADILELNQRGSGRPFLDLQESVPKALRRFRKKPGYLAYMAAIEDLLPHWTLPLPLAEVGQNSTSK